MFLAIWGGMGWIANWGFQNGDFARMTNGVDSWDNICGENNALRKTDFDCPSITEPWGCKTQDGCKWKLDQYSKVDKSVLIANASCYNDVLESSNAGLDLRNFPHQYYTDPSSRSAMILCVSECPTADRMAAQASYISGTEMACAADGDDGTFDSIAGDEGQLLSSGSGSIESSVAVDYCKEFSIGPNSPAPYGMYSADENNKFATNNQDLGNCVDNGDVGSAACDLTVAAGSGDVTEVEAEETEKKTLTDVLDQFGDWAVNVVEDLKNTFGIGAKDDWDVAESPDWEQCKAAAEADPESTLANAACANTGMPKKIVQTYDTSSYTLGVFKRCVPQTFGSLEQVLVDSVSGYISDINDTPLVQRVFDSVAGSFRIMLLCLAISVAVSYLVTISLAKWVRTLVLILILLSVLVMLVVLGFLYAQYAKYRDIVDNLENPEQVLDADIRNRDFFKICTYFWSIVTAIMLLLLIALRKKIWIAATFIMEASKAVFSMPSILFTPIFTFFWLCLFAVYWVAVAMLVASTDRAELSENSQVEGVGHAHYVERAEYNYFFWLHIFGGLWALQFIHAAQEMTIAGCVTDWYKSPIDRTSDKKDKLPWGGVFYSIGRLIRYHLGTLALGALIIAICQLIQLILLYVKEKLEAEGADKNEAVKYAIKCCMCCMWCLEKCLKYINRNAYIEVTLHGYAFCNGAIAAFKCLMHNFLQVAATNFVGKLVFLTMKVLIVGLVEMIAYYWLIAEHEKTGGIPEVAVPLLIIGIATYFVAASFTEIFEMTVDTLLICFCEDKMVNEGEGMVLLAPKSLLKCIGKYNKTVKAYEKAAEAEEAANTLAMAQLQPAKAARVDPQMSLGDTLPKGTQIVANTNF